jgi:hypothetical protein
MKMKKIVVCIFIIISLGFSTIKVCGYQLTLTEICELHTGSRIRDLKVVDNILFALDTDLGLKTYNISNPTDPSLLGYFSNSYTFAHDIHIDRNCAFIADYEDGLEIINISDPTDLTIIGDYSANAGVTAGSTDVYKSGNLVFLASQSIGLEIINCSDLYNPVKIGSYYDDQNVNGVYSSGDQVFISEARNGFKILNITNLECTEIFHFHDSVSYQDFFVLNNLLYTVSEKGITIFDISDLSNIVKVGEKAIGASYGFVIKNMFVYVSSWELGLQILDVSDPDNIEVIAQYTDGGKSFNIDVKNNLVFVADVEDGIEIIQVSDNNETSSSSTPGFKFLFLFGVLVSLIVRRRKGKM